MKIEELRQASEDDPGLIQRLAEERGVSCAALIAGLAGDALAEEIQEIWQIAKRSPNYPFTDFPEITKEAAVRLVFEMMEPSDA